MLTTGITRGGIRGWIFKMIKARYEYKYVYAGNHYDLIEKVRKLEEQRWEAFISPVWIDNKTIQQKMYRIVYE